MPRWLARLVPVAALAAMAPAASADSFVDTTPGTMAFAVPAGVTSLTLTATAGTGGDLVDSTGATLVPGGRGALVTATVAVFPGEQLQLTVASNGGNGNATAGTNGAGGAPDGGTGGWSAAGGGGATRVLSCQGVVCPVGVIAAGGGGAGASGFVSLAPSYPTRPGGPGGAAGARGTDGTSDTVQVTGGSGGEPGTAGAAGTGGSGAKAGDHGAGPTGGAGGNPPGNLSSGEGGGGGGGGVFGGGGGGSGASGIDSLGYQGYAGGGGGGGGSSLVPSGGTLSTAPPGAVPGIVLTWTPPVAPASGSGSGSGSGGAGGGSGGGASGSSNTGASSGGGSSGVVVVAAAVSRETLSPRAFPAAPSGPSALAAKRRYGTTVGYTLNEAAAVRFTVVQSRAGRKARAGRCVKPTEANRKARKCRRLVTLPGSFTRAGSAGANSFRFSGRLAGRKLKPGRYRLVATPTAGGKAGRAASASFQIIN